MPETTSFSDNYCNFFDLIFCIFFLFFQKFPKNKWNNNITRQIPESDRAVLVNYFTEFKDYFWYFLNINFHRKENKWRVVRTEVGKKNSISLKNQKENIKILTPRSPFSKSLARLKNIFPLWLTSKKNDLRSIRFKVGLLLWQRGKTQLWATS